MTKSQFLVGAACTVLGALFLAGCFFGIRAMDRADNRDAANQAKAMQTANTICGSAPLNITTHSSGWDWGPYLKVYCPGGHIKIVQLP